MMQLAYQDTADEFLTRAEPYLKKNEAEHNLLLSLCQKALAAGKRGEKLEMRWATLFDNDNVLLAAMQAPTQNLILSKGNLPEIENLAESLAQSSTRIPGIVGPAEVTSAFSEKWAELTGQKSVEHLDQIVYTLKKVSMPANMPEGKLRWATAKEADLLSGWIATFLKEVMLKAEHLCEKDALQRAKDWIAAQSLAVWDVQGKPVSIATAQGTDTVARIGTVYTPVEYRGKGYASALVANLSQLQLDQGKEMCCLHADARNPVSNSIYRKIGYEFAGRSCHYVLETR